MKLGVVGERSAKRQLRLCTGTSPFKMRAAAPFDQHRFCCTAWRWSLCSRRLDCGCGHNIRKILAHLRALLAALLASLIQAIDRAERDQITAQAA